MKQIQYLRSYYRKCLEKYNSGHIKQILSNKESPRNYDDEMVFQQLQQIGEPPPEYGYDHYNTWLRGSERALEIMRHYEFRKMPSAFLEVGCGDGMTGLMLSDYGVSVTLNDLEDWRDQRTLGLSFIKADICTGFNIPSSSFDLIYSFNTFEHISDPKKALEEILRVCKTGGHIYLMFGPLFASSWGLHAYHSIYIPYAQFIFSPYFIDSKFKEFGIFDLGDKRNALQHLNRWVLSQFNNLWLTCGCVIVEKSYTYEKKYLGMVRRFPYAFQGRGLCFDDLVVHSIHIILRKE